MRARAPGAAGPAARLPETYPLRILVAIPPHVRAVVTNAESQKMWSISELDVSTALAWRLDAAVALHMLM